LLALAAAGIATAATVTYRWVDAEGVHYSDQPHPGADKIVLGLPQTYSSAEAETPAPAATPKAGKARAAEAFHYDSCAVVQPAQDQVLINVEAVNIAVEVHPAKRSSDRVVLSFDAKAVEADSPDQMEFKITPIDRGTHTVAAVVHDAKGKSLCHSPAVSFEVRQPSVLAPANPLNPKPKH
jgi:hypothetical protein